MYKRILAAVIIIIVAFAYVQWGMDYIYAYAWEKTAPDRQSLVNDVTNMKRIVNQPVTVDQSLVQQAAELQAKIEKEAALFPVSENVDITTIVDTLLHLAQDSNIAIIPLRNGEWSKASQPNYQKYPIQLIIAGDTNDIMSFVDKVEDTMLHSIKIDSLDLGGDAITAGPSFNGTNAVEGYITVSIYGR
jgi:Tfp pilus assembly protein PilO